MQILFINRERRVIGISGSPIWPETLTELIFNSSAEFRWSPEGPVNQIQSSHLHVGAPEIFSDLLRSLQMLKRESGVRKATESYRTYSIPGKTAALVPEFALDDLPSAELQPRFLRMKRMTCPWVEHDDDDDEYWNYVSKFLS